MTLKNISYSGIVKLALLFIIIPRLVTRLYAKITGPLFAKMNPLEQANLKPVEAVEGKVEPAEFYSALLTREFIFILSLLIGTFLLTKIIEYLAQNTKLGDLKLGSKTD